MSGVAKQSGLPGSVAHHRLSTMLAAGSGVSMSTRVEDPASRGQSALEHLDAANSAAAAGLQAFTEGVRKEHACLASSSWYGLQSDLARISGVLVIDMEARY